MSNKIMDEVPSMIFTLKLIRIYGQDLQKGEKNIYNFRFIHIFFFYSFLLTLNVLEAVLHYDDKKLLAYLAAITNHLWVSQKIYFSTTILIFYFSVCCNNVNISKKIR